MRFNTVDQQYFSQRERSVLFLFSSFLALSVTRKICCFLSFRERQNEEPVFAPGQDISSSIKAFAERRTDIFGVGEKAAEQTVIGKKV